MFHSDCLEENILTVDEDDENVVDNSDGNGPSEGTQDGDVPIFGDELTEVPVSPDGTPFTVDITTPSDSDDVPMSINPDLPLDNVQEIAVLVDGVELDERVSI